MTKLFFLKVKVGKFLANLLSALVLDRDLRHRVRYRLDPLNPERCTTYLTDHYAEAPALDMPVLSLGFEPVWMCWLQGLDQAPQLVKNCVASVRQHCAPSQRVVVLTADNFAQYITLPRPIIDKWLQGKITPTHFSDLIRIFALAEYGGYWVDATCLFNAPVPQFIAKCDLFLFRSHGEFAYTLIQSCFIHAAAGHYLLRKWCAAMTAYWEHEDRLIHYFTLHLMYCAILEVDDHFIAAHHSIPWVSDEPIHVLIKAMLKGEPYTEELMEKARRASFVQKLTYKFSPLLLNDSQSLANVLSRQPSI